MWATAANMFSSAVCFRSLVRSIGVPARRCAIPRMGVCSGWCKDDTSLLRCNDDSVPRSDCIELALKQREDDAVRKPCEACATRSPARWRSARAARIGPFIHAVPKAAGSDQCPPRACAQTAGPHAGGGRALQARGGARDVDRTRDVRRQRVSCVTVLTTQAL